MQSINRSILSIGLIGAAIGSLGVSTAEAQYFGRNKVQYESFDFEVLRTKHFDIYFYEGEGAAVDLAALMAERWYERLSRILKHELSGRQPLILYANAVHFRQTNTTQGDISEGTGGVTEVLKRRIVLPFAGPLAETDHVLGHELVHAFQFDMTGAGGGILRAGVPAALVLPLWFIEGMAEYLSLGHVDANTAMWMRDAVREELPTIQKLSDPRIFPYRYGQALWAYIAGRWGDETVGRILKATRVTGDAVFAFQRVLRTPADTVVRQWHDEMRRYYLPLRDQTEPMGRLLGEDPEESGRKHPALIAKESGGGRLNIAPALSPDGKSIVFISEKDLFSIDVFLADAETGEIKRKIVKTTTDPHFESIQFISSAGAWDFAGRRFVFGGIRKGRPVLSIYDVEREKVTREVALPEIGEVFNPSFAPDGNRIVFAGQTGGLTDMYVYDLAAGELRRLTNDPYADLQPAWSPDGSRIAFVTDRFGTGLPSLMWGNYRLATMDPVTGTIEEVQAFPTGKHINPQWGPDGSLYFISNQNGIPNVYRTDLGTGELWQVTNVFTGVSGITALSPALSVSTGTGKLAMSVFEEDVYRIYSVDDPAVARGGPVNPPFDRDPAVLPPADRSSSDLVALLDNAFFGLPQDTVFESRDYSSKLFLDYISQPSLAVGADAFGTFIGGGAALFWSDMLGNHNLVTALQANGSLKDVSAIVGYTNLSRRLNWGVVGQQTAFRIFRPILTLDDSSFGRPVLRESIVIQRQINRQASVLTSYPLSRVQRIEFTGGFLNIDFSNEVRSRIFDAQTGIFLGEDDNFNLPSRSSLNMGQANAALVYDNSLFGVTGPIVGQRYRIEGGVTAGSLDFFTALVDYRKYWMPVRPFTLAFRIMHFGYYGSDAEDNNNLNPLFLGFDGLVRGYEFGSFDFATECTQSGCPAVDRLLGSKIAVANLEFRFPLFGVLGVGEGLFGALPLDFVLFGDAGLAWCDRVSSPTDPTQCAFTSGLPTNGDMPDFAPFFAGGDRDPVFSAGAGLRFNMANIFILELAYVFPFNRPDKSGRFQFGFVPGF